MTEEVFGVGDEATSCVAWLKVLELELTVPQRERPSRRRRGYTLNTRWRIRQHNGESGSSDLRTKRQCPWEMLLCIYGLPYIIAALQDFEDYFEDEEEIDVKRPFNFSASKNHGSYGKTLMNALWVDHSFDVRRPVGNLIGMPFVHQIPDERHVQQLPPTYITSHAFGIGMEIRLKMYPFDYYA
ncbi:hypothetical protein PHJA_002446300 [Phtheirospermum japonicum]|uniref:Uncharacterized protein n=1 Tax=Phtheirospermum japonicum TaxID=374723 RepID=A0A830D3J0_9LAMI|nr:hypothetical protein PHJA_002446300 [Phtheirospermum japonicum]